MPLRVLNRIRHNRIHRIFSAVNLPRSHSLFPCCGNSPTELQKDANKGALIAGAVFAVLTTVAVAVMAWFWCRFTRPSSELDYEEARREAEERAEREERDLEEQLQRQRRNEMLYASLFDFPKTGYSAIEPVN